MRKEIENIVCAYLNARLSVPVACEVPKGPPGLYVVIEKIGSSIDNGLWTTNIAVQSIGKNLSDVIALDNQVVDIMPGLVGEMDIFRCECESDYDFTNQRTKEYRYQAVFEITHL